MRSIQDLIAGVVHQNSMWETNDGIPDDFDVSLAHDLVGDLPVAP